ncbi:hypothetical protein V6N11_035546 [Hibiscus sabdariffa]|uniref:Uncharacterized protein n=1 Tax=Hibiscus sabdariffa TaxID=183260 RepID=A0ABR2R0Q8_9ROSI
MIQELCETLWYGFLENFSEQKRCPMMAQSPRSAWIYARINRPGRPWKQQYSESRSCTEATLKAKTQNLSKQNTSREISARADKDKYKKRDRILISILSQYPGSMSVSERRKKDSQSQRLEAQAH